MSVLKERKWKKKSIEQPFMRHRTKWPHTNKSLSCIVFEVIVEYMCDFLTQIWWSAFDVFAASHMSQLLLSLSQSVSRSVSQQLMAKLIKDASDSFPLKKETCHSRLKQPLCVLVIICSPTKAWRHQLIRCLLHVFSLLSYKVSTLWKWGIGNIYVSHTVSAND